MPPLQLRPLPFRWSAGDEATRSRIRNVLEPWKGTPYVAGQRLKGVGTDCVGFACSVMDELLSRSETPRERLPRDSALNDPRKAREFMRLMLERYSPMEEIADGVALPGDILVTGGLGGGPGHVIVVGHDQMTTWQAGSRAVIRSGWTHCQLSQRLFHHKRLTELRSGR